MALPAAYERFTQVSSISLPCFLYLNVLAALDALGYQGYVGLEYNPTTSSEASFAWLPGREPQRYAGDE